MFTDIVEIKEGDIGKNLDTVFCQVQCHELSLNSGDHFSLMTDAEVDRIIIICHRKLADFGWTYLSGQENLKWRKGS